MAKLSEIRKLGDIIIARVNCDGDIYTLKADVVKCKILSAVGDNGKDFSDSIWTRQIVYNLHTLVEKWGDNVPEEWTLAWF